MRHKRPWIETVAGAINDPVHRLRFLRAIAPRSEVVPKRRSRLARAIRLCVLLIVVAAAALRFVPNGATARITPAIAPPRPIAAPVLPTATVWVVDTDRASEVYSNGLRIETGSTTANRPRTAKPAGIVFHSTESKLAPFEAEYNDDLKRIGESLIDYIRRRRSYHYLIDRFGRAFRIVAESDIANHAGHSVWADANQRYVNLNDSFFGVAFEGRGAAMTTAQARSGAMLVEILRSRYDLPAGNCVTHAQVSVNPSNRRVGYHIDWAAGFPFADLGLPDNYAIDLPAVWAFGFDADAAYRGAAGESLRRAIDAAERRVAASYSAANPGTSGRKKKTIPRMR